MKQLYLFFAKVLLLALVLLTYAASDGLQRYEYRTHQMSITGASNWQPWSLDVKEIGMRADFKITDKGFISLVGPVVLMVKTARISAPRPSMIDRNVVKALKIIEHPYITFNLNQIDTRDLKYGVTLMKTIGQLTVAGTSREIEMDVYGRVLPNGEVEIWGSKGFNMEAFNIPPPAAFWGIIRSDPQVKVDFDIILRAVPKR